VTATRLPDRAGRTPPGARTGPSPGRARARRAARRELTLGLAVLALVGLAGWVSTVAINGVPWSAPYTVRLALPAGAPLLHSGDDVWVGGERVGQVESVGLAHGSGTRAIAALSLNSGRIGAGASARIRPRGLAGAVYVDLAPGHVQRRPLPSGTLISATGSVELTDVVAGFDATTRRALAHVMTGDGAGIAGRGVAVNHVLASAPSLLSDADAVLTAARPAPGVLRTDVGDATSIADAVAPAGSTALAGTVGAARTVLQTTGAHESSLAQTVDTLPGLERTAATVLPRADALLAQVTSAAGTLGPGIAALTQALPGIRALEQHGPAIATLGSIAATAAPVLTALTPALAKLVGPAAGLTPLTDPITELAHVLIPYRTELIQAPLGFTRWGNFTYNFGTGAGHRAVRFSMVLTCALARDPYPAPGAASKERKLCP
jgi:ABC-type transporter Mla subunit MlaD